MPVARLTRGAALAALLGLAALATGACGSGEASASPSAAAGPIVVTFEVAGGERFKALLTDPADIDIADRLAAGDTEAPSIPNGLVIRGETGVNEGWTWSLDPDDFEFADVTIEVCDGVPSDVEAGLVTSDRYCPWSAIVADIQPAP
jgi:hypothetical protein